MHPVDTWNLTFYCSVTFREAIFVIRTTSTDESFLTTYIGHVTVCCCCLPFDVKRLIGDVTDWLQVPASLHPRHPQLMTTDPVCHSNCDGVHGSPASPLHVLCSLFVHRWCGDVAVSSWTNKSLKDQTSCVSFIRFPFHGFSDRTPVCMDADNIIVQDIRYCLTL